MNKQITSFIFAALICCSVATIASAQTLETANQSYIEFIKNNNDPATKDLAYQNLYKTYSDYLSLLNSSTVATQNYIQSKNRLRDLQLHLRNAAIHYSQKGNNIEALKFAQCYVDIPLSPAFEAENIEPDDYYTTLVYFAASGTYNTKDYDRAIRYFREYINSGEKKSRHNVFLFMTKACMTLGNLGMAKSVVDEAILDYPTDFNLLSMGINCAIDSDDSEHLQKYITKALTLKPNDNTLINIQGKLYEENFDFQNALNIYLALRSKEPQSLEVAQHLALNYYNLGVSYNNMALSKGEDEPQQADSIFTQSTDYFRAASAVMEEIVATDPNSVKYMQALAVSYVSTQEFDKVKRLNEKILALGGQKVSSSDVPSLMAFSEKQASGAPTDNQQLFSVYAKEYVEHNLRLWQTKDPYETVGEYKNRVNKNKRDTKIKDLLQDAEARYIATNTKDVKLKNLKLKPYDAENRVFLAQSDFGEIIIAVPRENNEAKVFESSWLGVKFNNPEFYINNDKITLASVEILTPEGKQYRFDSDKKLNYAETEIDINFDAIDRDVLSLNKRAEQDKGSMVKKNKVTVGSSDIDMDIPVLEYVNDKIFAVIISNENYQMVPKVPMALNDGYTFAQYCNLTLGLPKNNIRTYSDATYGTMLRAVRDIKNISNALDGNIEVLFYYAGHGIPDERSKGAYLLPVDADGQQVEGCYSLDNLYADLGSMNSKGVYLFLDACFSGAKRDGGTISTKSRGVAIKAKVSDPRGNMVIFSAASDDETALPLSDQGHGLFTYHLLKKLKATKGNITLQELGDYVISKVKSESIIVNRKIQTPSVVPSEAMSTNWGSKRLIPQSIFETATETTTETASFSQAE